MNKLKQVSSTLRGRLTFFFLLTVSPLVASLIFFMVRYVQEISASENRQLLRTVLRQSAEEINKTEDWQQPLAKTVQGQEFKAKKIALFVVSPQRNIVIWRSQSDGPNIAQILSSRRFGPGGPIVPGPPIDPTVEPNWYIRVQPAPPYVLVAARKNSVITQERIERTWAFAALGFLTLCFCGLGSWVIVSQTLRPIRLLSAQAESAATDSLHVHLEPPTNDKEVVHLVETLNDMLERLSKSVQSKGRFYSAASHELRTPLQALGGHLELALSKERSAEEYKEALQEARTQAERLSELTQGLLFLHQLESAKVQGAESLDLEMMLKGGVKFAQSLHPNVEIRTHFGRVGAASGVSVHAQMLIRNLLENACQYAVEPWVEVDLTDNVLTFKNKAVSLPAGFFEQIGETYLREDQSRVRSAGGNGLGLTICSAIAKANNWTFEVSQEEGLFLVKVIFV